ncbi:MAG: glycosyl hydrolase 108 family protein [Bryobacteraceae bacterium]
MAISEYWQAFEYLKGWEGDESNDPNDPGGYTHWGVTRPVLEELGLTGGGDVDGDGDIDIEDIKRLTVEGAREVFYKWAWQPLGLTFVNTLELATKIFDLAVNLGKYQGTVVVQRAVNGLLIAQGQERRPRLIVDGSLGPQTRFAVNQFARPADRSALLACMCAEAAGVYRVILKHNEALEVFRAGWLRRAYSVPGNVVQECKLS